MPRIEIAALAIGLALAATPMGAASAAERAQSDVVAATRSFLTAYAQGERQAVLAQVDPEIVAYGSDVAEVFHGVDGVRRMLDDDQKLWRGAARIGDMQDLSIVQSGDLAAVTFQAPFILGERPPVLVRFSMVWKRGARGWRLVQSANGAPTVGQSAAALLKAVP